MDEKIVEMDIKIVQMDIKIVQMDIRIIQMDISSNEFKFPVNIKFSLTPGNFQENHFWTPSPLGDI